MSVPFKQKKTQKRYRYLSLNDSKSQPLCNKNINQPQVIILWRLFTSKLVAENCRTMSVTIKQWPNQHISKWQIRCDKFFSKESEVKSGSGNESSEWTEIHTVRKVQFLCFFFSAQLSLLPHLALPLLVPSKEFSDLIQKAGVLLPAAQPEGGLCGACRCHGGSGSW